MLARRWLGLQLVGVAVMAGVACAASPPPQDVLHPRQSTDHDDEVVKRLNEMERTVSAQAVEIFRLQLRVAKLENNEPLQMEILQNALASRIPDVQVAAVREIGALAQEKAARFLPALRQVISKNGPALAQVQALDILSRYPEEEDLVLQAAQSNWPDVRRAACIGLRGYSSDRGFETLQSMVKDADQSVRLAAVDGIGLSKHPKSGEALLRIARESTEDAELERALQVLGRKKLPASFDVFTDRLKHKADTVRWSCLHGLEELGDPRAVEFVRPFIGPDQPQSIREKAVEVLGRLKDLPSIQRLINLLRDPDERLRAVSCRALGDMGSADAMEDLLAALVADREERVRHAAWDALQSISAAGLDLEEKLVHGLVERKRKSEIEFMMGRIRQTRAQPEQKPVVQRIEIAVAEFLMKDKDFKLALEYWKALSSDSFIYGTIQLAVCYREVGDLDGSQKLLKELLPKLKADGPDALNARIELARTLCRKDPKAGIEEASALLATSSLSAEVRQDLEIAQEQAAKAIVLQLKNPAQKAAAIDLLKALGKKALAPILSLIQKNGTSDVAALIEAANAIAGTAYPPEILEDKSKLDAALKAWSAFLKN
jgi:HEAT repeat protein